MLNGNLIKPHALDTKRHQVYGHGLSRVPLCIQCMSGKNITVVYSIAVAFIMNELGIVAYTGAICSLPHSLPLQLLPHKFFDN